MLVLWWECSRLIVVLVSLLLMMLMLLTATCCNRCAYFAFEVNEVRLNRALQLAAPPNCFVSIAGLLMWGYRSLNVMICAENSLRRQWWRNATDKCGLVFFSLLRDVALVHWLFCFDRCSAAARLTLGASQSFIEMKLLRLPPAWLGGCYDFDLTPSWIIIEKSWTRSWRSCYGD